LALKQPRIRDHSLVSAERNSFSSSILPPELRRSKSIAVLIPWLDR